MYAVAQPIELVTFKGTVREHVRSGRARAFDLASCVAIRSQISRTVTTFNFEERPAVMWPKLCPDMIHL